MIKIRTALLIFGLIFFSTTSFSQEVTPYLSYDLKTEYNAKVAASDTSDDGTTFENSDVLIATHGSLTLNFGNAASRHNWK